MNEVGRKLRRARRLAGLSQRELGRAVRLSQPAISSLETGFLIPGPQLQERLARAIGLPVEVLFGEGPEGDDEG